MNNMTGFVFRNKLLQLIQIALTRSSSGESRIVLLSASTSFYPIANIDPNKFYTLNGSFLIVLMIIFAVSMSVVSRASSSCVGILRSIISRRV